MKIGLPPAAHLALAMAIVGSSVVVGKVMVREAPVFLASTVRFALACAVLVPLVRIKEGRLPRLGRKGLAAAGAMALCGSFLFTICLLYGLQWTTPGAAGIITSTTPACMGLTAWLCLGERMSVRSAAALALATIGVGALNLLASSGPSALGKNPTAGNMLVLAAVVCESIFLLLRKTIKEPLSALGLSTLVSLFGLALFAPVGIFEALRGGLGAVSSLGWFAMVYYGLVVTVLAYLFWFAGVARASAALAGVMTGVMPVSALLLSALFLNERIQAAHVLGCAAVLASIGLLSGVRWRAVKPSRVLSRLRGKLELLFR